MRAPRIFIQLPDAAVGQEITPSQEDARHLTQVLRLETGAQLTVVERTSGREFTSFITTLTPLRAKLANVKEERAQRSRVATLSFALCKGEHNDLVIEKCCELGVKSIILWQAERSVVRLDHKDHSNKLARWQRIAESAAKQSSRTSIPEVRLLSGLQAVLELITAEAAPADIRLCCSLAPEACAIRTLSTPTGFAHIMIGPEGDFTETEHTSLTNSGFIPVTLGPTILRAETAAIAAVAMVNGLWGELG